MCRKTEIKLFPSVFLLNVGAKRMADQYGKPRRNQDETLRDDADEGHLH